MRHYSEWMNQLTDEDLEMYQYREVLVIQPTWMMARATFDRVGGYIQQSSEDPYPEVVIDYASISRIWTFIIVI